MKNFLTMAALALVGAIIAGCSGSDDIIDNPQPATQKDNIVTMKTTVGLESGGETRALDPVTRAKTFAVGDQLAVYFTNQDGYRIGINSDFLTAEDISADGKSATFTFKFEHLFSNPTPNKTKDLLYIYPGNFRFQSFGVGKGDSYYLGYVYTYQDGTLETLGNNYDWATFEGPWTGENLPNATLENQLALLAIKLKDDDTEQYITEDLTEVVINIENGKNYVVRSGDNPFGQDVIYVGIFPDDIKSEDVFHVNATDGTNFYAKTLTGKSYAKGLGYNITWRMTEVDLEAIPLTMEARSDGTIVVNNPRPGMQFSLNGGAKTTMTENPTNIENLKKGDKVQFYGNGKSITRYWEGDNENYTTIAGGTASVKVYGNIMSLVDEEGFATNTTLPANNTFKGLFSGNLKLTDASDLLLPATTLRMYCYQNMFYGCTNLTDAPELPAEELIDYCYAQMFYGCTSLETAPELLAEELVNGCYDTMFNGCSSLSRVTCFAKEGIITGYIGNSPEYDNTTSWLGGVAAKGTFTGSAYAEGLWPTNSTSGIPAGWSVDY